MNEIKTLIIYKSTHHGNTKKIAEVIAQELKADMIDASDYKKIQLESYDLVGFGSGIYNQKHHRALFSLIENFPQQHNKPAFIFSTASIRYKKMHVPLKDKLLQKGFYIKDEFICKGFMDHSFTKFFFGGINKNRPNSKDLQNAREFAGKLKVSIKF